MQLTVPACHITTHVSELVDAWHAELVRVGVPVGEPPSDQPWGPRDMTVVDPDGNQLRICTRLRT